MKKICSVFLVLCLLLLLCVCPSANSSGYLVKVAPKAALFSRSFSNNTTWVLAESDAELAQLKQEYNVLYIEPDYEVKLFYQPTDQYISHKWDIDMTGVQDAWNIGCSGGGVRIGVIDSGAYLHDDLKNNLLQGHDFLNKNDDTNDTNGHGTGVSGIIAATANNIGIIGMAYSSKIIPLKCFAAGKTTTTSTIINALYNAANYFQCDVINMSLGVSSSSQALREAIDYVVSKGIIVVAATGNDGNSVMYYPAAYDSVTGVGAVTQDKKVADYSQRNKSVSVTAPGDSILTLDCSGQYTYMSGTSAAAPFVTALAAIAKNIDPSITSVEFKKLIEETATDAGAEGYDINYGYGIINTSAFIEKLMENKKIFVSPENIQNNGRYVYVTNHSDHTLSGKLYLAEFVSPELLSKTNIISVSQNKDSITKYALPASSGSAFKRFLWTENLNTIYSCKQK